MDKLAAHGMEMIRVEPSRPSSFGNSESVPWLVVDDAASSSTLPRTLRQRVTPLNDAGT
ncbi:MAG: hypothetical protein M3N97_00355 [Pseudomonadota bacterium]|nr:hypothetical protein [Pseudomonadota bacterium]